MKNGWVNVADESAGQWGLQSNKKRDIIKGAARKGEDVTIRCVPVAQLDRVLDYESRGREFESLRARHAEVAELADAHDSKSCGKPCRFESGLRHQTWGYSSVGRALESHSRGQRFESA